MPLESKRPPDVPHPALGAEGLDKLEASLNALSRQAAAQSFSYLLLWFYFMFTVVNVTDLDLLLENPIKLPVFNLEIGLKAFFIGAPVLFWLVQLYMVRNVSLIADAAQCYLEMVARQAGDAPSDKRGTFLRVMSQRLDGFVVTRQATRFDRLADGPRLSILSRSLTTLAAAATLVVMPLALYLGFQLSFLGYQSEFITWWHRGWLVVGLLLSAAGARRAGLTWWEATLGLLGLFVGLIGWLFTFAHRWKLPRPAWSMPAAWTRFATRVRKPVGAVFRYLGWAVSLTITVGACASILTVACVLATFPGEYMTEAVLKDWPEVNEVVGEVSLRRTLSPKAPPGEWKEPEGGWKEAGPAPLDLRHRDFSGRSLRGVVLVGARLHGADMRGAKLQGASLWKAQLNGANIALAQLHGAIMRDAELQGAFMQHAQLLGADMSLARLQGADMSSAHVSGATLLSAQLQFAEMRATHLQGAFMSEAGLEGANMWGALLQGAEMSGVRLQISDLSGAKLQGAMLSDAQLQGANMSGVRLDGASLDGAAFWRTNPPDTSVIPGVFITNFDSTPSDEKTWRENAKAWLSGIPNESETKRKARQRLETIVAGGSRPDDFQIFTTMRDRSAETTPEARSNALAAALCADDGGGKYAWSGVARSPWSNTSTYGKLLTQTGGLSVFTLLDDWLDKPDRCPTAKDLDVETKRRFAEWRALEEKLDPTGELRKKTTGELLGAAPPRAH